MSDPRAETATLFSNIKAWLVGTHHGVSAKHLPRYLREWSYRFNRRNLPDGNGHRLVCVNRLYRSEWGI
jgi:hypothetical protein